VAGEIDPVRVVDDAIEDGIGVGGIADQLVPFVDGDLAGPTIKRATVSAWCHLPWFSAPQISSQIALHAGETFIKPGAGASNT
jgi:hypothetical protein